MILDDMDPTTEPDWPNTHHFAAAINGSTICTVCGAVVTVADVVDRTMPDPECPGPKGDLL